MKIRVSKVKEDKGELRGLLLSFLLLLAAVAAFGTGSLGFLNRTGERSQETLRKAIARGCVQCYAIEGSIRQVWNIWKKITGSRLTMINTMCFMTDLLPISCRRLL